MCIFLGASCCGRTLGGHSFPPDLLKQDRLVFSLPVFCLSFFFFREPSNVTRHKAINTCTVQRGGHEKTISCVLRNANKQYGGTTTLRNGIKKSINVVAVKLSDEITQELGYEYCEKFGISTLVKDKTINGKVFDDSTSQTLALGGIT